MSRALALALAAGLAASALPDRKQAVERGLRFIYRTACDAKNFAEFGEDYLWCLYSIGATSRDPALARQALSMGRERAAFTGSGSGRAPSRVTSLRKSWIECSRSVR